MNQIESFLNEWFGVKAPHLPTGLRKFIVAIAPWLVILGVIMGALNALNLFNSMSTLQALNAYGYGMMYGYNPSMVWLGLAFMVAILVLQALAIPGLLKKEYIGWRWIFYSSLLSFAQMIVMMNFVGAVIGGAISWYILFQVRSLYSSAPALHTTHHQ